MKDELTIGLVGNPNCGKTTLFNKLTGLHQKTANWPGVTVDKTEGILNIEGNKVSLLDLPGTYSLSSYTLEEEVTKKCMNDPDIDLIINVVDASVLEKSLYLTLEIMELQKPIIMVLNMMDLVHSRGITINLEQLSTMLGNIKIIPISAKKGTGLKELQQQMVKAIKVPLIEDPSILQNRHRSIRRIMRSCISGKEQLFTKSDKIDTYLAHPILGIPIFLGLMACVFFLTFTLGDVLKGVLSMGIRTGSIWLLLQLEQAGMSPWLLSLLAEGVLPGIGGVLTFLPNIIILYTALAILEDSGYMARVAYIMNEAMGMAGLSGKAFLPVLLGFGCTVPAAFATKTLESMEDRKHTIFLLPFISCSAKLPVYMLIGTMFFGTKAAITTFLMYLVGIAIAFVSAIFYDRIGKRSKKQILCIELPDYKVPDIQNIVFYLSEKLKEFLIKAGTTIFASSVILWCLLHYNQNGIINDISKSFGAGMGKALVPIFSLAGLGFWEILVALMSGIAAKEAIISSLFILYGIQSVNIGMDSLKEALISGGFHQRNALALLVFTLLYTPCVSALAAIKKETASFKWSISMILFQLAFAWFMTVFIYQVSSLIM